MDETKISQRQDWSLPITPYVWRDFSFIFLISHVDSLARVICKLMHHCDLVSQLKLPEHCSFISLLSKIWIWVWKLPESCSTSSKVKFALIDTNFQVSLLVEVFYILSPTPHISKYFVKASILSHMYKFQNACLIHIMELMIFGVI